ncbi:CoA-binding protein [Sediminitomix flava]|uniref:CoA-binding domain-containing protein n=1 Tax=Sediminitomix flava TaxID=379075 RepID=A0A315ZAY9_SEDFL|nr:CoA-binding protein [Sediminitomix flava]PWJ42756.1 hypothetical protein BC781_102301 [Sediminitomix flava]
MKTLILGATPNPKRYAYLAAHELTSHGHEIVPVGVKQGELVGQDIINDKRPQSDIDTITMYIGPKHQEEWYEYILDSKPKRIVFNPGTENPELMEMAEEKGIEVVEGCTLVMLSIGIY